MSAEIDPPAGLDGVREALREAVEVARLAPSMHNTQPWQWRIVGDHVLELRADRSRQLPVADPDGLLLTESCGTALHHARQSLAAEGWLADVAWLPTGVDPDLLARVTVTGRDRPDAAAARLVAAARQRRTDRRPVADRPVPDAVLDQVAAAVAREGIAWHQLRHDEVVELTVAMSRADEVEVADEAHRDEIASWVGGERAEGLGIPDAAIPEQPPRTRVPGRYFGPPGTLAVEEGHDVQARYAILHGAGDGRVDWLRAGQALSAAWLTATSLDLSLLPISAVVEVAATRLILRRMLAGLGYPYLAVRLGYSRPDGEPEHTPRLATATILDDQTGGTE